MTLAVQHNYNLRPYNSLQIDALAREWVQVQTLDDCRSLPALCADKPRLVLGGGSNLVLAGNLDGIVIHNRLRGIHVVRQDDNHVWLDVAGGEIWDELVDHSLQQGWSGLENLSAIPGTVGAAPVQNIGAYGVEFKDVAESITFLHLDSGECQTLLRDQCRFAYRDSLFKQDLKNLVIITRVRLRLDRHPRLKLDYGEIRAAMASAGLDEASLTAQQLRQLVIEIRGRKLPDPREHPNVGSFFKNPLISGDHLARLKQRWPELVSYPADNGQWKIAAGWLLDRLGWKGRQWGQAAVHHKQALVLINRSHKADDLLALKNVIQADVRERTGIELEMEPLLVGG